MHTIKLISTHRLDPEKGRDLILHRLGETLRIKNEGLRIQYDIYGDGSLRAKVEALAKQYPDNIRYHGFVPLKVILSKATEYDFVLMPSRFLETFGLAALDFAQFGVATIGYQKGGVAPFIVDSLNISNYPGGTEQEQFDNAMETIIDKFLVQNSEFLVTIHIDKEKIKREYSQEVRLERFEKIVNES